MSIFELASRQKLRFETSKGLLSAEDLWDLPLSSPAGRCNLNDIAIGLHRELKDATPISFVDTAPATEPAAQLRFDIVKHVIDVRLAENKAKADEAARAEKKQQILALIAEKQHDNLRGKSEEELRALLAGL